MPSLSRRESHRCRAQDRTPVAARSALKLKPSIAALIVVLGLAAPVAAGPYEDGSAAYVSGRYETALRLWQPMASEGHSGAQFGLGLLYDMGRGVAKNNVTALMWFDLSAAHGSPGAVRRRDLMAQRMTPAQIIEAQKLAREWQEERNSD